MTIAAVVTFVLISLAFYLTRSRMVLFNISFLILLGCFFLYTRSRFEVFSIPDFYLSTAGLLLYWFGLLGVRTMLRRSFSLGLLANLASGSNSEPERGDEMSRRIADLQKYKLASLSANQFELTWFGRIIAGIVTAGYFLMRVK